MDQVASRTIHRLNLSIIIPTFNRRARLERVLDSIAGAECAPPTAVEVLVVDDGTREDADALFKSRLASPRVFDVKLLKEIKQGKAHARNLSLAEANGNKILILDDDVVVDRAWPTSHLEAYVSTGYDALQGKILPGRDPSGATADFSRLREYNILSIDYGDEFREIRGLTGANMSFKREVFEKVGFFTGSRRVQLDAAPWQVRSGSELIDQR